MASLTIIPYNPTQANRPRAKGVFKHKPSILPVDMPQSQAVADRVGGLTMREDSNSQKSTDKGARTIMGGSRKVSGAENDDIQIEIDSLFGETDDIFEPKNLMTEVDAESKVGSDEIRDSDAEFGTDDIGRGMRDIGTIHHPLKHKSNAKRQESNDDPFAIPDSDTESESNSESEDGLLWKKQRVGHPLVGRRQDEIRSWRRMIGETDDEAHDEANETEFETRCTRVSAGDAQSRNGGKGNGRSYPHPAASSTHQLGFDSTLFKSADRVESRPVARVGSNGEWGIHGIIGKEVIEGKVHYCVDWEPTMIPLDELSGAKRLVQEFEAKEQARQRKRGNTRKRKHRNWHRGQR